MAAVTTGLRGAKPAGAAVVPRPGGRRLSQISCRDSPYFVTELIRIDVGSIKHGAIDETGISGAATFPGLVQPFVVVVGDADAGQRRQYRSLGPDVPRASR